MSFCTTSGTVATRVSPTKVSLGTPMIRGMFPPWDGGYFERGKSVGIREAAAHLQRAHASQAKRAIITQSLCRLVAPACLEDQGFRQICRQIRGLQRDSDAESPDCCNLSSLAVAGVRRDRAQN